ncbi:MAG: glycerophosphodiester phosphodiesterase [Deltaproteobacteria bacterium]|nr:glycerophosphodiester phosphodiesterase [Deltaproteobacteria bacterium]
MVRLYAHRGAAAELPENTLAAFRRALELGADALETDAHLTRDGHLVLSHDPSGRRMAGVNREIRRCTLAEVRSWDAGWGFVDREGRRPFAGKGLRFPTLEEALAELPQALFNVDLKQRSPDMIPATLELLRRMRAAERVLLASFHSAMLRHVRRLGYRGPTSSGRSEVARLALLPWPLVRLAPPRGTRVQVPPSVGAIRLASKTFLDRCHRLGIRVDYWTINAPDEALRLVALGADGIMTDDPARIAPVLGKGPQARPL